MRRLFWRIFFSFWLLLVALVLVLVLLNPDLLGGPRGPNPSIAQIWGQRPPPPPGALGPGPENRFAPPGPPGGFGPPPPGPPGGPYGDRPRFGGRFARSGPLAQQAVQAFQRGGPAAAAQLLDDIQRRTGIRLSLLDSNRRLLAGTMPDQSALAIAGLALQSGGDQIGRDGNVTMRIEVARDQSGAAYALVQVDPPPYVDYAAAALRIVIALVIASIACWWLSREITLPIIALQLAARNIAAGRFATRVMPRLGGRGDEIADLAGDFDTMAGNLETMVSAQTRLLGDVSHELRSPLARLSVASAIARRSSTGEESAKALDRVDREVERLNELVGQLMLMSKLELDSASRATGSVDLAQVLTEVCNDAGFEASAQGKRIDLQVSGACSVQGNRELLRSALENVIRNAVRYTASGTVVEVCLAHTAASVTITVRDHGPGVQQSELSAIFKPFYRTTASRDRDTGGVGLGLAIAERAITRHSGKVAARNSPTGGLIVSIELPL